MKPTIGRIVIFYDPDHKAVPAIITKVHNDSEVNLTVFFDGLVSYRDGLILNGKISGWKWPELVTTASPVVGSNSKPAAVKPVLTVPTEPVKPTEPSTEPSTEQEVKPTVQ